MLTLLSPYRLPSLNTTQTMSVWLGPPVMQELTAYTDRSFTFELSTPQTTWMLKRCAGIEKVSLCSHRLTLVLCLVCLAL